VSDGWNARRVFGHVADAEWEAGAKKGAMWVEEWGRGV
jgi:hypothetical protein